MATDPSRPEKQDSDNTPRWVKVLGVGAILFVLALIILMLALGPDGHGPGRHLPFGSGGEELPKSSLVAHEGSSQGLGPVSADGPYR